jgi:prefoldin subunit 5
MIKFIRRFFEPSVGYEDDDSLIDAILDLEYRLEYLEKDNIELSNALQKLEDRLERRIDRIQPVIYNLKGEERNV